MDEYKVREIPGFGEAEFPSTMTDEEINKAISEHPSQNKPADSGEYIVREIPGFGEAEFPAQMSEEQIQEAIATHPSQQKQSMIPEGALDIPKEPGFNDYVDQATQGLMDTGDSIKHGLSRFGAGVGQFVYPGIDKIAGTNLTGRLQDEMKGNEANFEQRFGNSTPHQALALASEIAPSFIGGAGIKAAEAPMLIQQAFKNAPGAIKGLANAAGIFGKNAGLSAAYAPIAYDKSFERTGLTGGIEKAKDAALIGGLVGTGVAGLSRAPQVPGKLLSMFGGGNKNIGEVTKNIEDLRGIGAGLGDVVGSPALKGFQESALGNIPFSGAQGNYIKVHEQLQNEGKDLLKKIAPEYKGNAGAVIKDSLIKSYDDANIIKRKMYNDVDATAKKEGVKVYGEHYLEQAQAIKKEIKSSEEFGKLENSEKKAFEDFLEDITNKKSVTPTIALPKGVNSKDYDEYYAKLSSDKQKKVGQVKSANLKISDLNESASDAYVNGKKFISGAYARLASALKKDLVSAIDSSGSKTLKNRYDEAQKYYSENVAPFDEGEIARFVRKDADSDTLVNYFLKSGKDDRINLLNKLTSKISPQEKNMLTREYLGQSIDFEKNVSSTTLANLYKNLNDKTRDELFSDPKIRKEVERYVARVTKNPEAANPMYNPKTGHRGIRDDYIRKLYAAALSAFAGGPAGIAGLAGGGAGLYGLNKFLNSQKARDVYLKGLKPFEKPGAMTSGIAGALGVNAGS